MQHCSRTTVSGMISRSTLQFSRLTCYGSDYTNASRNSSFQTTSKWAIPYEIIALLMQVLLKMIQRMLKQKCCFNQVFKKNKNTQYKHKLWLSVMWLTRNPVTHLLCLLPSANSHLMTFINICVNKHSLHFCKNSFDSKYSRTCWYTVDEQLTFTLCRQ